MKIINKILICFGIFLSVFIINLLLHEQAHYWIAYLFGYNPTLGLTQVTYLIKAEDVVMWKDIAISSAGPLMNTIILIPFTFLMLKWKNIYTITALVISIAFTISSFLPFVGSDMYHILRWIV